MRQLGFGAQGQQQSDRCSFPLCTICRAEIRVSVYAVVMCGYQLLQVLRNPDSEFMPMWWLLLQQCCYIIVLYLTVLCHEFGHGNMARWLGGQIDHILLWVFGGICFSTRAPAHDNRKILRDELLVVAAGPSTHFLQVPLWGLMLWPLFALCQPSGYMREMLPYENPMEAFLSALDPRGNALVDEWWLLLSEKAFASALLWSLVGTAIQLNVALFFFNVFFPMYPADGSKLLVTALMFCCGVPARTAALVLLCFSVPCGLLFVAYFLFLFTKGISVGGGGAALLSSVMGFMGIMSLVESYTIWELRTARRLHTHPLFATARSWRRVQRDAFGVVHTINTSDFDDEASLVEGSCREVCAGLCGSCRAADAGPSSCLRCLCPCLCPARGAETEAPRAATQLQGPQAAQVRAQRERGLLNHLERQAAERQRDVRDLIESRQNQQQVS